MRVVETCLALLHLGAASAFQCRSSLPLSSLRHHRNHDHLRPAEATLAGRNVAGSLTNGRQNGGQSGATALRMADDAAVSDDRPQSFATGYSTNPSLAAAIEEATTAALASLPPASNMQYEIDLAMVVASSLYEEPSTIVPTLVKVVEASSGLYGYGGVRHLVGGTAGGVIGSRSLASNPGAAANSGTTEGEAQKECIPIEAEATPAVSVTLALLPDVEVKTFHVSKNDVPEFDGELTRMENAAEGWKREVGLAGFGEDENTKEEDEPIFMLIPSPAFQTNLEDFLRGLQFAFPQGQTFGGIASTVSSLSRARIFAYSAKSAGGNAGGGGASSVPDNSVYGDGCVGVALKGDLRIDTMVAQNAKPVGGVYRVVAAGRQTPGMTEREDEAARSTIGAIVLDEAATVEDAEGEEYGVEEEDDEINVEAMSAEEAKEAKRAKLMAEYAKARIPKPPLAEANFVMKALSDDDQAFMRSALLIGLERGGGIGSTPNELARLAKGEGHRFTVRQVASAGMKDGSVTFPLGSVDVSVGARCRFFVRDGDFAKKEVEALWTGYKKKELEGTLLGGDNLGPPTACFVLPTLDRGAKLFGGKTGYESGMASEYLSGIPSISGFFANGVLGKLDGTIAGTLGSANDNMLHGSSSQYVVFRSKTKRPFYSPRKAKAEAVDAAALKAEEESAERELAAEDEKRTLMSKTFGGDESSAAAPRSEDGELVVRRREIHSGRAMSVSTVEWSVAEKMAKPTSALEGYMWEKETQVDRLRERISLALLLSQTKMAMADPTKPKPRDWIGPVKRAAGDNGSFVIIPECKRMEPVSGSLRKRYDLSKLVKQLAAAGVPAISVNSDGVLFGGTMEDITKAREALDAAAVAESLNTDDGVVAPPVLASDLLLYPYQLYKLRLAGADAVTLVAGALESKDLLYLTKIAKTVQLQVVASVTSEVQIDMLTKLGAGSIVAMVVSNRDLETFDFDDSGEQALSLLRSEALAAFREKHGDDVPVLVEGRVGIVESAEGDSVAYVQALKDAGAFGAIVGGGMATVDEEEVAKSIASWTV
eukprot:CAMPEP_0172539264 /NCGR_PEP_ID=MMETSP1067-20121228/10493_1 /TAXON_ID=265564 ORGANISM="Thalassiosira punctigera, Strain Tpunct2005C2" /NCGR_SAMPLE_ID=MMETSP1067 /ASSEMBLY_ACC=CAM_ASM_000444 /LENGTH=1050 /DNA_ID=CAMNT_0013324915 /DNA_START=135 /DNA_END=3287 /DNA_ORIENTATION=-